jgi:hypothetical protein
VYGVKCPKCGHEFIPPVRLSREGQERVILLAKALLAAGDRFTGGEVWDVIHSLPGDAWEYQSPRRYLLEHSALIHDPAFAGQRGERLRWKLDRGVLEVIAAGQFELFDTPAIHGS